MAPIMISCTHNSYMGGSYKEQRVGDSTKIAGYLRIVVKARR